MRRTYALEVSHEYGLVAFAISGRSIIMELAVWEVLETLGPLAVWTSGKSSGRLVPAIEHPDFGVMMAARLVMNATERHEVGYRDGNPWHLVRSNIVMTEESRSHYRRVPLPVLDFPEMAAHILA